MHRRPLALAVLAVAAAALAGCGSGSGPGHDSPEAAVRGAIAALQSGDIATACDWVAPSQRANCTQTLAAARAFGPNVSFRVDNFAVKSTDTDPNDSSRATVHVDGTFHICVSGQCINGASLLAARPGADSIPAIKEQGQWWVAQLGGDTGGGAVQPPVASPTDSASGVTTDSGSASPGPADTASPAPASPPPAASPSP